MLAFGLGTMPALVTVGIAGQAAGRRWQRGAATAAPVVMLLNAALLAVLALRGLVIDM
jgi:sulfite exporter TauE/SafE